MARLVLVRHGRRVMVRLGAVLCGSVMYGLVWLERLGQVTQGVAWNGLAGKVWHGEASCVRMGNVLV